MNCYNNILIVFCDSCIYHYADDFTFHIED